MGNEANGPDTCCGQYQVNKHVDVTGQTNLKDQQDYYLSSLAFFIKKRINNIKPFHDQLKHFTGIVKYGDNMYQGRLDKNNKASGLGKLYKSDGSLYVGNFQDGKATGQGYYFTTNGLVYHGKFNENKLKDENGQLTLQDDTKFIGNFVDNVLNGKGVQKGLNYTYEGTFQKGNRINGTLKWQREGQHYQYLGQFDQNNQFNKYGELKQPTGHYQGEFKNGQKHGLGTYYYNNGLKYIGSYVEGEKQGQGTIYNKDGTISYAGQWKLGIPHGKGSITKKNGQICQGNYSQGIDTRFLPD